MIVSCITDGLGNQMFQYAVARRLASVHGAELFLDLSNYTRFDEALKSHRTYVSREGSFRSFQLNRFNIAVRMIRPPELLRFLFCSQGALKRHHFESEQTNNAVADGFFYESASLLESICRWLKSRNRFVRLSRRLLEEKHFHFDPAVLSAPDNVCLKGYWASERYFADIREVLLKEFVLKTPLSGRNAEYAAQIDASESVAVHVRRGDYLGSFRMKTWGLIPVAYYDKCMDVIAGRVRKAHVFVFSNDISWCRENMNFRFPVTYVEGNDEDSGFYELELMRRCKYTVISNSSFSWWGAWLNCYKDRIVCAPSRWFNEYVADTKDLIPDSWVRVSNV